MKVLLSYKLRGERRARRLQLAPGAYFDPLDPGEVLALDSVPRHDHAHRYLAERGVDRRDLEWTLLRLTHRRRARQIRTEFQAPKELDALER